MNHTHLKSLCLGSSLLLLMGVTACAPAENFDNLEPEKASSKHLDQLQSWALPSTEAEDARRAFVSRCVSARGGKYSEAQKDYSLQTSLRNGVDADQLKEHGYLPAPTKEKKTPTYDARGLKAYTGNPAHGTKSVQFMELDSGELAVDGCFAESLQYIYGSVEDGFKVAVLAPQMLQSVGENVREDPAYKEVENSWGTCMKDHLDSDFTTFESASDYALTLPQSQRLKVAQTDAECRGSNNVDSRVHDIESTYFEAVYQRVKRFADDFEKIQQRSQENVVKDRENPQKSSPVEQAQPTDATSTS